MNYKKPVTKKLLKTKKKESKLTNKTVQKTTNKMIEPDSESDDSSFVSDESRHDIFGIDAKLEENSEDEDEPPEIKPGRAWVVNRYTGWGRMDTLV